MTDYLYSIPSSISHLPLSIYPPGAGQRDDRLREPRDDYGTPPTPILGPINGSNREHPWARERLLYTAPSDAERLETSLETDLATWRDPRALANDEHRLLGKVLNALERLGDNLRQRLRACLTPAIVNPECRRYCTLLAEREDEDQAWLKALLRQFDLASDTSWREPASSATRLPGKAGALFELYRHFVVDEGVLRCSLLPAALGVSRRAQLPALDAWLRRVATRNLDARDFGIAMIQQIRLEQPELWRTESRNQLGGLLERAVESQSQWIYAVLPRGIIGVNAPMLEAWMHRAAHHCASDLDLPTSVAPRRNPFPWMEPIIR